MLAMQPHRSWMNSPGLPACITGSLQICVIHENFQGSNNQRAPWKGDPVGPSQSTTGIVDAALSTDQSCTSLGKNTPVFTAPWASQELTGIQEGKLIAVILAGYTH